MVSNKSLNLGCRSAKENSTPGGEKSAADKGESTSFHVHHRKITRKIEKLGEYRKNLSNSTAYAAGHLSSMVLGKMKSMWSAKASTFNLGLNQFAGRTYFYISCGCCSIYWLMSVTFVY